MTSDPKAASFSPSSVSRPPNPATAMTRLAIVEDNSGLRQDLVKQLGGLPELEIVGEFPDFESAAAALPKLKPDVVLADIQLPGRSGIELVREWKPRLPDTEFLMLTTFDDDDLVFDALRAGTFREVDTDKTGSLAPRERELLDLLARGRTYKECADALVLSIDTVRTYIRRIYRKLQVRSRHEAVAKVRKPPIDPGK